MFFEKRNKNGEVIATNICDSLVTRNTKSRVFTSTDGDLLLISSDPDVLKSTSLFKKLGGVCHQAFNLLHSYFNQQIIAHSHTLKKIQGQMVQKIEGVIPNQILVASKDYSEQKQSVLEYIHESPGSVADALIYLQKRVFEMGAHMSSFELLNLGEEIKLDIKSHNLRRLLINIMHAFEDTFKELGFIPHFMFTDEVAEANKIQADYKILNAAFYNFFDNVTKYGKPYSEIRFHLFLEGEDFKLEIAMKSLRIEKEELTKIFQLGYRGLNCSDEDGSGVGMYVFKNGLQLNGLMVEVDPDYSECETLNEKQYILNKFVVVGKAWPFKDHSSGFRNIC